MSRRRVVIMGAGGREFHDFNTVFRDAADAEVVAFTAAQIPGIADRVYPPSLAGAHYPAGIPILPESRLDGIVTQRRIDEVVLSYSDLSHAEVMDKASLVEAAGADFRLLGPDATMLSASVPVIAVCAVRTGCGKSQVSREVASLVSAAGLDPVVVRHPMAYGDLEAMRVQRFASLADIDAAAPTIEEREEYEAPVRDGLIVYAGVDYAAVLDQAQAEADVIVWDGGNNDLPFFRPDVHVTVADALRPGHELGWHPGEINLRRADVVVLNKVVDADASDVDAVLMNVSSVNPGVPVVRCDSRVRLDLGPSLAGARVIAVEDGPTLTHGGMPFGAATVAARKAGAVVVDPRPGAVGGIAAAFDRWDHLGPALPAMGYGTEQLRDLEATIAGVACDAVIVGSPVDLGRLIEIPHPVRRVHYGVEAVGRPTLTELLGPDIERWQADRRPR